MTTVRRLLLESATARSRREVAQAIVNGLAQPNVVLARLWLVADQDHLQLEASAGYPRGGGSYNRTDGEFRHVLTGQGKIGRIASARSPFIARSIRGDEEWLSNPAWIARQGVRAFLGFPLVAADTLVGVLALFDRVAPTDATIADLQFLADYTARRLVASRDDPHGVSSRVPTPVERGTTAAEPLQGRDGESGLLTRARLRELEKQAIEAALTRSGGKVFGVDGAAALLGMKPTTLASRIKALGVRMR